MLYHSTYTRNSVITVIGYKKSISNQPSGVQFCNWPAEFCVKLLRLAQFCHVYYVTFYKEHNKHDIKHIERVCQFFSRAVFKRTSLPPKPYEERFHSLYLPFLEYHRMFCDLIMCFKIVNKPFQKLFHIEPNIHHKKESTHTAKTYRFSRLLCPLQFLLCKGGSCLEYSTHS